MNCPHFPDLFLPLPCSRFENWLSYPQKCEIFSRLNRQLTCSTEIVGKRSQTNEQTWALNTVILRAVSSFSEEMEFPFLVFDLHSSLENFCLTFFYKKFEFPTVFSRGSWSLSSSFCSSSRLLLLPWSKLINGSSSIAAERPARDSVESFFLKGSAIWVHT